MLEPRLPFTDAFTEEVEFDLHEAGNLLQRLRCTPPHLLARYPDAIAEIADAASDLLAATRRTH